MEQMFMEAYAFNQNIGGWNTAKVTNMEQMFFSAHKFNQPIGSWDTSSVIEMEEMFCCSNPPYWDMYGENYFNAFNQTVSAWTISSGNNVHNMFLGMGDGAPLYTACANIESLEGWGETAQYLGFTSTSTSCIPVNW